MKGPKVSVIVPCYGVEGYLPRCMDSLLHQTLTDIEIILVDDESPDRVPEMCDEYARTDSRVKVIHKKNGGLGYARNSGLEAATGEYVAFVDSDDYVDISAFDRMQKMAETDDSDAVFSGFYLQRNDGTWKPRLEETRYKKLGRIDIHRFQMDMIASAPKVKSERKYWTSVWHSIYRMRIIKDHHIKFYSERDYATEDLPFQMEFLNHAHTVSFLPECFYHYCINGISLTHTFNIDKFHKLKYIHSLLCNIMDNEKLVRQRIDRFVISDARMHFLRLANSDTKGKLRLVKLMMDDEIWKQVQAFKPSYFPLYQRVFYLLTLWKRPYMLYAYSCLINFMKRTTR